MKNAIVDSKNILLLSDIQNVPQIGDKFAKLLNKLSIFTIKDLLYHFPIRYIDLSSLKKISELKVGERTTIIGTIVKVDRRVFNKKRSLVSVTIYDGTSYLSAVWFNQDYLKDVLAPGKNVALSGETVFKYGKLQMDSPFYELIDDDEPNYQDKLIHTNRIIPIHGTTAGLTTRNFRRIMNICLKHCEATIGGLDDPLYELFGKKFLHLNEALRQIHFPSDIENLKRARLRMKWEELFYMQLALALEREEIRSKRGFAHIKFESLRSGFMNSITFELTNSQKNVLAEIDTDMAGQKPMHRLLQGDVGSGKTIIAVLAMLRAIENGYQAALMAPTEILAEQHYKRYKSLLKFLDVKLALLKGSLQENEKAKVLKGISSGEVQAVFGTHALIQKDVRFKNLSLVIVDEQHRFGVEQRAAFKLKGDEPDMLAMTATPIPRTLALTAYGDLELSIINEKPQNRKEVITHIYSNKEKKAVESEVIKTLESKRQVFIVCPLIEDSENLKATSVKKEIKRWTEKVLKDYSVGMIHGKMDSKEKSEVMTSFENGKVDVLFSTTVIEVGVDVPNACLIVILNAERYGLSQLHQMRGRVGRSSFESKCILVAKMSGEKTKERLEAIVNNYDGFSLAEIDLKLRREGQLFGQRQWGKSDLKLASLPRDMELLTEARKAAFALIGKSPGLKKHPEILNDVNSIYNTTISFIKKS